MGHAAWWFTHLQHTLFFAHSAYAGAHRMQPLPSLSFCSFKAQHTQAHNRMQPLQSFGFCSFKAHHTQARNRMQPLQLLSHAR